MSGQGGNMGTEFVGDYPGKVLRTYIVRQKVTDLVWKDLFVQADDLEYYEGDGGWSEVVVFRREDRTTAYFTHVLSVIEQTESEKETSNE